VCRVAVPHSDPENNPVSEVIQSSSPVGKTDGNSGSRIIDFDRHTASPSYYHMFAKGIRIEVCNVEK